MRHILMLIGLLFVLGGCVAGEPDPEAAGGAGGGVVYPITAEQANDVLLAAFQRSFAGQPIHQMGRSQLGYWARITLLVDHHDIFGFAEPARGKKPGGEVVDGYRFKVVHRGTIYISGPIRANKLAARIHEHARRLAQPLQYAGARVPGSLPGSPKEGSGSGVVVNAGGDVLTNQHVVAKCKSAEVELNGQRYPASLRVQDSASDLAILHAANMPATAVARFSERPTQLGAEVIVLGYPLSDILGTDLKVTSGNVSGQTGLGNNRAFFQFTAPIQPGNSGGPVIDGAGIVVGIVSYKLREIAVARQVGTLTQLINFGVKARTARSFMETGGVPFTASRQAAQGTRADIVAQAQRYTVRIICK